MSCVVHKNREVHMRSERGVGVLLETFSNGEVRGAEGQLTQSSQKVLFLYLSISPNLCLCQQL
jgi:hypothetical protein